MANIIYLAEDEQLTFPLVYDDSGLVAIGGNLSPESLINAYSKGVFPWYNDDEIIQWWSPEPRCVLYPTHINISKSMRSVLRSPFFQFKVNENFEAIIESCSSTKRIDQDGTWIHDEMKKAYTDLHSLGIAMSAETYFKGELVGGLYGLKMGNVFFGESMFSKISNASKYALIKFAEYLHESGVGIIDCQLETPHLISLGAQLITREKFLEELDMHL